MPQPRDESKTFSRRTFLQQMQWAPLLFLPAPLHSPLLGSGLVPKPAFDFSNVGFTPHYPANSSVDDLVRLAVPGSDQYLTEGYAAELVAVLRRWSRELESVPPAITTLASFLDENLEFSSPIPIRQTALRPPDRIEVWRREFDSKVITGREHCLTQWQSCLASLKHIETADFEIYGCSPAGDAPLTLDVKIRYELVGTNQGGREQRIGSWVTRWSRELTGKWRITKWIAAGETLSRGSGSFFVDITSHALGKTESYRQQMMRGTDYWRTVLDGAIGVDVYGNNGVAVGDFDNDGFDDLYVCQPAGLPNRLYRNRGDGTFEDVTERAGVAVLDFTACALFADFQNRGHQDLLVVCATGPLLYRNDGNGKFSLQKDAFRFTHPPQGSFTHAAAADYDGDGRLDLYFCLYSYYQGLNQYRYPVPYFDARNGPPNYLFHNQGDGTFRDRTEAAGLNIDNDRYSFSCSWGDSTGNGLPDLYVVNDFGRNCLYRNNGDGTFRTVSSVAKVDEAGAGMSACWLDSDNDGHQDIYAAGMWVAAGMRVLEDSHFHGTEPEKIRSLYRKHMAGNSLYRNDGQGNFENVATKAGVEMGRWSWSSDSWDFDHDGYSDLYVANGYISGLSSEDVSSFFWRQVVSRSPADRTPSSAYERGWNAMNELIRGDSNWNGHERNVFFANNRDGTFSDISGIVGLDFRDDSRAFALSDLDGDGRLEIVLKNRTAPQIRVLRLAREGIGNAIAFRLRGKSSNRDAIGSAVTLEIGTWRATKYLQAGSGFLSQHTKELFFGLGQGRENVRATVRWPGGLTQTFQGLPINHRIAIEEGTPEFKAKPFSGPAELWAHPGEPPRPEAVPDSVGTWLIEPVKAPSFSAPDLSGNLRDFASLQNPNLVLHLWTSDSRACVEQLRAFQRSHSILATRGMAIAAINLDDPSDPGTLKALAAKEGLSFPVLIASRDVAGMFNIVYRYLLDRHRDLELPISFLIDRAGNIIKLYQGVVKPETLFEDLASAPTTSEDRARKALPFPGILVQDEFQRNAFTYGVAFFQHGLLDEAAVSFRQAIAQKPDDPEAYYNLGTLFLRRGSGMEAEQYLGKAVTLRPNYPEAWNNLGMVAAQKGDNQSAIQNFQRSLELRPSYATALLNLGNLYRRQGRDDEAQKLFEQALENEPENAEVCYGLGMLFARKQDSEHAREYLEKAIELRSDYGDALNNLGVLLVEMHKYPEAEEKFKTCLERVPGFDQAYLNLARLYMVLNQKEKAKAILESLLLRQPQHQMAQQMLQMLY